MNKPTKTLDVLIVEDMEGDAQLIVRLLKKAGYDLVYEQVETAGQMHAALEKQNWDVVISDYKMPQFDGFAALTLLRDTGRDIPFIVVSGTIGEETAVSMMKAGAHDYLIKGNLARLVPAVERELNQARIRGEQKTIEEARAASEAELRALVEQVPAIVYTESAETRETTYISGQLEKITGYTPAEWTKDRGFWKKIIHPEDLMTVMEEDNRTNTNHEPFYVEYRILTRDGRTIWIHDEAVVIQDQNGSPLFWQGVMYDITQRKRSEELLHRQSEQISLLYEASQKLNRTLDLNEIYRAICDFISLVAPNDSFAISSFDHETRLITCRAFWMDNKWLDVSSFPPIPLEEEGRGTQSIVIRTGQSLMLNDYRAQLQTSQTSFYVNGETNEIVDEVPPDEEDVTRSALIVPLKAGNQVNGVIQLMSYRLNAYTENQLKILEALSLHVASAEQNAMLYARVQKELSERKQVEDGIRQRMAQLEMLYQSGLAISQLLNPGEIGKRILELLEEKLNWNHTWLCLYNAQDESLKLLDFNQPGLGSEAEKHAIEESYNAIVANLGHGLTGWALQQSCTIRSGDVINDPHYVETYPGIRSGLYAPMKLGDRKIGVIGVESEQPDAFSEADERLIITLANQAASALENARLFEETRQRVAELEMLYQSGLALSRLLNPKEIGEKILELLEQKLNWRHTRIRLYHPEDDSLELLNFNRPGLSGEADRHGAKEHFQSLITHSGQGLSGWVVKHGQPVRSGDVTNDPRYVEAYPGIRSGLYIPMKLGERVVGALSIEDESPDAFSEADERLITTLANQAANAFENARLFEETRRRVTELETVNRISLTLRAASKPGEMLKIVLDEALSILGTAHGSIELYNKNAGYFEKIVSRGWLTQLDNLRQKAHEGIAGRVFTSGEPYISSEFSSDPETWTVLRSQIPPNWGGICMPIHTTQQTLGVMTVSVPSERELDRDEIRLLSILTEMIGAALQRMQLHEQTVRRLEQLNALRAVDQAISSSLDVRLTLNILLTHIISQLKVDAVNVLLFHSGSGLLELAASRGFQTYLIESTSLGNSFAGRAILEHRSVMALDFDTAKGNPQFGKFWEEEGFVCYWCVPLVVKGEVKGVLEVYCRKAFAPDSEWIEFLEAFAGQAAIAIDNTQLFENLQRANMDLSMAYDATIEGWSRALDMRDHETEGHTLRVTDLTLKLARAMQVSELQMTAIRRGALLHDIGKMGVPDSILLKEGKLTEEEWAIMRQHAQFARDMLMPIAYLNNALDIPYYHHEKWDGTGYPQGLKGNHIPLAARIFAVIDVWDALTSDRPYRKRWTRQKALGYMKEQSGKHFDPQVVEAFLKNIEMD